MAVLNLQVTQAGGAAGESQTAHQSKAGVVTLNPATSVLEKATESSISYLGLRFVGATIPSGSKVLGGKLELWVPGGGLATMSASVMVNAASGSFTDGAGSQVPYKVEANNISARNQYKKGPDTWGATLTKGAFNAYALQAGVIEGLEELFREAAWKSGDALMLFLTANEASKVTIENFAGTVAHGAKLQIEYEALATPRLVMVV